MQHEITKPCHVFGKNGAVAAAGWARAPVFICNEPSGKRSGKHGERDCYFIGNGEVSLYLSVENIGLEFAVQIAVADLKHGGVISDVIVKRISLVRHALPDSDDNGELLYSDKRLQLQLTNTPQGRFLKGDFIDFAGIKNLYFNLLLKQNRGDSLNTLAPFERGSKWFYLKRFMPQFTAGGVIRVGGLEYMLAESTARAYFDRIRFSVPRRISYRRLSADGAVNGRRFSLCLASRVGDNRFGNENCFFYEERLCKLENISVRGNSLRLDRPFFFRGSNIDIVFKPFTMIDREMAAVMNDTTVVFGRLYGEVSHPALQQPLVLNHIQAHLLFTEL